MAHITMGMGKAFHKLLPMEWIKRTFKKVVKKNGTQIKISCEQNEQITITLESKGVTGNGSTCHNMHDTSRKMMEEMEEMQEDFTSTTGWGPTFFK